MDAFDSNYCYTFPAIRAVQAGKPFYIATCPLRIIPKIFSYNEEEVPAELRAQRTLNKSRIPEITRYLLDAPKEYVFSALTASVESESDFKFIEVAGASNMGTLSVPMDSQMLINDGQHRRAAIEEAIRENPELGQDNIAVLFFVSEGIERSQQMFADLNKYAVRPSPSLGTLYDHRDQASELARYLSMNAKPFAGFTEFERPSISVRSSKIFTLSGIKQATRALLGKGPKDGFSFEEQKLAEAFWNKLNDHIAEWQQVQEKKLSAADFRQEFITAHGIGLQALAIVGKEICLLSETEQEEKLQALTKVNWLKSNSDWSNRAMQHGRLSKAVSNIFLTAVEIKRQIGLPLSNEDLEKEKKLLSA